MLALTRFFDVSTGNASLHLKIFFEDGELSRELPRNPRSFKWQSRP